MSSNQIPGPYDYSPVPYHYGDISEITSQFNQVVKATAPHTATPGSIGFIISGSDPVDVTLIAGGTMSLPGSNLTIYPISVARVDSGSVYLLYK